MVMSWRKKAERDSGREEGDARMNSDSVSPRSTSLGSQDRTACRNRDLLAPWRREPDNVLSLNSDPVWRKGSMTVPETIFSETDVGARDPLLDFHFGLDNPLGFVN